MLIGKRVVLDLLQDHEISKNYIGWMNDPQTVQGLESRFAPQSKQAIESYIAKAYRDGNSWLWGVFLFVPNPNSIYLTEHVGNIRLTVNWIHRFGELGIVIGKPWWGKGLGSEAISLAAGFALTTIGLHKVWAGVYNTNPASVRAFEKAGFKQEAVLKSQYWDGVDYQDDIIMTRYGI